MKLRVGIVGTGFIAPFHMRGYREAKDVELLACCDCIEKRAKTFAEEWGFRKHYRDYHEMLAREDLDVLSVCTPNRVHLDPTLAALRKGIHVLCEKPIAVSAREARRMVDAARRSTGILTIGHNLRFETKNSQLKKLIDAGELGEIYYGRCHTLRRAGIPGWGEFHKKEVSAGGPLIDIGVHGLDLILWFMGFPGVATVSGAAYTRFGNDPHQDHVWGGRLNPKDFNVEDFASGFVRLKNGATLSIESSWAGHIEKDSFQQTVLGDRGGAQTDPYRVFTTRNGVHLDMNLVETEEADAYREEILHFLACIRAGKRPLVLPEESLQVMQVIDGLYRSAETGREVKVRNSAPVNYKKQRKR